jgi:hypothetical protein
VWAEHRESSLHQRTLHPFAIRRDSTKLKSELGYVQAESKTVAGRHRVPLSNPAQTPRLLVFWRVRNNFFVFRSRSRYESAFGMKSVPNQAFKQTPRAALLLQTQGFWGILGTDSKFPLGVGLTRKA